MEVRRLAALALLLAAPLIANGCGNDAVDVDGCKQIEEARCRQAPVCGIPIEPPYFTSGTDVDACVRYYDVACLHGLAVSDPGPTALDACVAAIEGDTLAKDGCSVVKAPQTDTAACGWLLPSSEPSDASDAPSDAPSDVSAVIFPD
jgi:hypothetical protein